MVREREPRTGSPIYDCICEWALRDAGSQGASAQRISTTPGCKVHDPQPAAGRKGRVA